MREYRGSRVIAPLIIFSFGARWRWKFKFIPRQLYPPGAKIPVPILNWKLCGSWRRFWETENPLPMLGFETRVVQPVFSWSLRIFKIPDIWCFDGRILLCYCGLRRCEFCWQWIPGYGKNTRPQSPEQKVAREGAGGHVCWHTNYRRLRNTASDFLVY